MSKKPLGIWVDKIAGFIKIDNGVRYLVLDHSRFNKFLRSEKSGIADSISHDFARTIIDSYIYLPIEEKIES